MTDKNLLATSSQGVCDPSVYQNGKVVAVITGGSAQLIERFVKECAEFSGQKVDWHYVGGRARVLALGDIRKVKEIMRQCTLNVSIYEQEI